MASLYEVYSDWSVLSVPALADILSNCMSRFSGLFSNILGVRMFSNAKRKKQKDLITLPVIKPSIVPTLTSSVFRNDFQRVMNFLNRVSSALGVTIPKPDIIETTKNVSHHMYEVLAHNNLIIPEKFKFIFKDEYVKSLDALTFYARAKSITEAKQKSLFHLAESLYSILKFADLFLPTTEQDPKKILPFIKFDLTAEQCTRFQNVISECNEKLTSISESNYNSDLNFHKYDILDKKYSRSSKTENLNVKRPEPLQGKLPIFRHYREIVDSVERNQVTIVSATTGSGKTTQIPKFILHHFQSEKPSIIVTQPRRVAAISLANRVAHELGEKSVGYSVGYSVRFDTVLPDLSQSNILFCTSGLFIKKLQSMNDDIVSRCTHLVLDEIHERDINTDILLLAVRRILSINKNLKVLIMSATLDAEKFHDYFSESGELQVGKPIKIETSTNYPVASYYLEDVVGVLKRNSCYPSQMCSLTRQFIDKELAGDEALSDTVPVELICSMTQFLHENKPPGSILCFLPGWEDIVSTKNEIEMLLSRSSKRFKIYCIHSSTPPEVAQSIFHKTEGERKIILATNIAESSITIPDVAYVVDSGKQKINMYNPALRMNSLKTTWISKSNSIQRLGRVGRTQPGEYYLLCSRVRHLNPSLPPEILRVGLEDVCLSVKGLGFEGRCRDIFAELLDKPNKMALRDAVNRLIQLDALEPDSENITDLGRILSSIPLNPSLGKALVLSHVLGCSKDMLTIAAGVGERILRVPRFEDEKDQFLDFIRTLRTFYEDDHHILVDFYDMFQRKELPERFNSSEMKHISILTLKRIDKVRQSLESQLKSLLPGKLSDDVHNVNMRKLLMLSAFYPDMALKVCKRNNYLLPGGISGESQKESMQYSESLETILTKKLEFGSDIALPSAPAKALVFEELFDAGHTMIVKSGVVDPVFCVLFADTVSVMHKTVFVDNWIRIISDDSEALKILLEMRELWKKMSREVLSAKNEFLVRQLKTLLSEISSIWNPHRDIEIK